MPRTVSIRLLADVGQFTRNVGGNAVGAVKTLSGELDRAAKAGRLDSVTNSLGGLGLGLAGVAGYAVKAAADFDKSMSAVRAATHASTGEINQLREAALQAGKDTSFSATEAAEGITELSKAGIATADVLHGGLKGALDLAAAGQLSVGEAAETAASALTQFKLRGSDVPHVADLLAAAAGKAQGSVHDMGAALNQAGLVASQTGLTIEDTTGTLAAFASAGLTGSDAGTSFKQMLLMLQAPSGKTAKLMKDLGISAYDASGQFVGITGLAGQLKSQLAKLTPEVRASALAQIFGADATRAASVMYEQGAEGIQGWIDKVNDSGYASETARIQTDNLAGDVERLKGSLETLAIEAGSGANSGLRTLAKGANAAVDAFSSLPGWVQQTVTVLAGVSGASLIAAAGLLKARTVTTEFMTELRNIGPMGERTAAGLSKFSSVATKFGLIGTAVGAAYLGLEMFSNWAEKRTGPTKANIDKLTDSISKFAATGQATGELAAKYGAGLQRISSDVSAVTRGMQDLRQAQADVAAGLSDPSVYQNWNPIDPQVTQRVKDLDDALTRLVQGGGAAQANIFLQQLRASGKLTAAQFDQLTGMLPHYTAAAGGAATANTGLAKGFGTAGANAKTLEGTLEDTSAAGLALTDVWNQLHGALVGTDRAMLAANKSIDEVKESFKENGKAIDGNSTAALKNRVAIGAATKGAIDAAQAKFEETGSIREANKVYDHYMGQLRKTLSQSKLTDKQVDALIDTYGDLPPSVFTKVGITGDAAVSRKLSALSIQQAALKKGMPISTSAARALSGDERAARQRGLFHAGGWTGPGDMYQPAGIVHADEFVISKKARQSIERQNPGALDEMNATGQMPGYAGGGRAVSWPFPVSASMTRIPSLAEALRAVAPSFGHWPSSPGAQRGDSGVWRKILALVKGSGISYDFGNAYRPGDPKWHGSGRAIDFMGFNQDRLAQFFLSRQNQVLELIHRTRRRDYGITRGHYNAMPTQWPLHRNHLHIAMAGGGQIREPVLGYGTRSGASYSFGERGVETVTPGAYATGGGGTSITIHLANNGVIGSRDQVDDWLTGAVDRLRRRGRV